MKKYDSKKHFLFAFLLTFLEEVYLLINQISIMRKTTTSIRDCAHCYRIKILLVHAER